MVHLFHLKSFHELMMVYLEHTNIMVNFWILKLGTWFQISALPLVNFPFVSKLLTYVPQLPPL